MIQTEARNCIIDLRSYIESAYYAGYDPYDALNSPFLRHLSCRSKWLRIAFTQFMRRCPLNLRSVLGIKRGHNPKGIALFLWGYTRLYAIERKSEYLDRINYLIDLLDNLRSHGYSGNCWGYNFDWQSRSTFVPKYTPTIVNSAFVGHVLLDTYSIIASKKAIELAVPITNFILKDLRRHQESDTFCFSYTPMDNNYVHNANLLGASLLLRLSRILANRECESASYSSLAYSMKHQHDDGSWFYAESKAQRWIDSFHTGFNLQAIRYFLDLGLAGEYREAYDRGVKYYAETFFSGDCTPKYYHDRIYPIDIHSPAQAICFFSREGEKYRKLTENIVRWMLGNMYSGKGYFYFRKGRIITNRIPYIRWSQAWVFHALTEYYLCSNERT